MNEGDQGSLPRMGGKALAGQRGDWSLCSRKVHLCITAQELWEERRRSGLKGVRDSRGTGHRRGSPVRAMRGGGPCRHPLRQRPRPLRKWPSLLAGLAQSKDCAQLAPATAPRSPAVGFNHSVLRLDRGAGVFRRSGAYSNVARLGEVTGLNKHGMSL